MVQGEYKIVFKLLYSYIHLNEFLIGHLAFCYILVFGEKYK